MGDDLWRDCAKWLTRCNVLRPDHKANWTQSTHFDLAYTLRDGVLLCNLLNNLDPGCLEMKDVNQKPQFAQFLCLRNIKAFLLACHDFYGLKESDLFEPSMLFDLTDFYRVLYTLSKLSNCPKMQKHNIVGFSVHKPRTLSQEDIYKNLNSNSVVGSSEGSAACLLPRGDSVDAVVESYAHYDNNSRNEEIYHDLCSIDRRSTATDSLVSCTITHSVEKRDYVINELVETEKNYVEVLSTLQRCFLRPLANILQEDDFKIVFFGIKELYEIHAGFHSQLAKAAAGGSGLRLSDAFLNWREKFLLYGEYCANLTRAQNRIQELTARSELVNQEVAKCQQEANNGKFKLRDILSVPMQRILKYHLLLEKLISETQPNHDDFRGLERSREAMVDVAHYINEVKRDSDTLQIMQDIQSSITDWELSDDFKLRDYGRLIKDGELRVKAHNDQKVRLRYVFIFDKVMLMCKGVRGDQYSFKESLVLADYKVDECLTHRDSRWNYQWILVRRSECTAYTLYARTEDLKRQWLKAIQDALDNIEPSGSRVTDHKFSMHSFDKPTTCLYCSKYLKGLFFQGYRCEACNEASHKLCIPYVGRCPTRHIPQLPPRPTQSATSPAEGPQRASPTDWARAWADHEALTQYLWFVGQMGRERASCLLEQQADGTFLLRVRPQGPTNPNETEFALSLKTDNKVKHMKMYKKEIDGTLHYYLSESRFFRSVVELINFYEHSSLSENFVGLDVRLRWPYQKIVAVAKFDFTPAEANQLPLREGCQVIILSKEGDQKGWWKGRVQDRVGFFPKVYVREISDNLVGDLR